MGSTVPGSNPDVSRLLVRVARAPAAVPLGPVAAAVAKTSFVGASIFAALPAGIAVFPQEMKIATSVLEEEFKNVKDGKGEVVEYVLCNKGL